MPVSTPQLPTETWTHIIRYLKSSRLIPLIQVSRVFHDISVRILFSAVKIYLVGKEAPELLAISNGPPLPMEETRERMMHRSWEILQHIKQYPKFAAIVKTLSVVAMVDSVAIFEKLCLEQALRAIPNLGSFYWFGSFPQISEGIAHCLPSSLHTLCIESITPSAMFQHLHALNHLQLGIPFYYSRGTNDSVNDGHWNGESPAHEDTIAIVESQSTTLRKLGLVSHSIGEIPMRVYSSLTDLNICVPFGSDLVGMDLVFHHAPLLESLSLVGWVSPEIFSILPRNAKILPKLTSFRLSCDNIHRFDLTTEEVTILHKFLEKRIMLRRLSIRIAAALWDTISGLLPTLSGLHNLEVFGIHAGYHNLKIEEINALASVLGVQMTTIHLAIPWNAYEAGSENLNVNTLSPVFLRLRELPHLNFLHLYGIDRYLPVLPEDLVAEMRHLEIVGLNRVLWDVNRSVAGIELVEWPPWKLKFAIGNDFEYSDSAWLIEYH